MALTELDRRAHIFAVVDAWRERCLIEDGSLLQDGEELRGVIEWYDRNSIRLNRPSEPSLMILKHYIKYMYKENEDKEVD